MGWGVWLGTLIGVHMVATKKSIWALWRCLELPPTLRGIPQRDHDDRASNFDCRHDSKGLRIIACRHQEVEVWTANATECAARIYDATEYSTVR
jgi:hypothetical protein